MVVSARAAAVVVLAVKFSLTNIMSSGWHSLRIEQSPERHDWRNKVEQSGLTWHTLAGDAYWAEGRHVVMELETAEVLEAAANELHGLCLEACEQIVKQGWWEKLDIPPHAVPVIEKSWFLREPSLYGRFDLAWNGRGQPKMLEYNADTPTSLLEAAIIQWEWLQDVYPNNDQLNSLHEALVERWRIFPETMVHFACAWDNLEDRQTIAYLAETAEQADKEVLLMSMEEIGVGPHGQFTDGDERIIERLFKLYPWEWMIDEPFFEQVADERRIFLEPAWKMMLSNKGILPVLWELFPKHPLLLPAYREESRLDKWAGYVAKPIYSREGANIRIKQGDRTVAETPGEYGGGGYVYQEMAEMLTDGRHTCVHGLWMVGDECRALSIREDASPITGNGSRFLAHRII